MVLVIFIARFDRAAGITGLIYCVVFAINHPLAPLNVRIAEVAQGAGLGLMTIAPRRNDPVRSLTLLPLLAWAFFWWTEFGQHSGLGYLLPVFVAVIFTTVKPALAISTLLGDARSLLPLDARTDAPLGRASERSAGRSGPHRYQPRRSCPPRPTTWDLSWPKNPWPRTRFDWTRCSTAA